jgi:DNA-binding transcriptional LysR family regulator
MDIDLLKTFLEVNRTRHFGRAAENLFLTQSAVSARVRQLEDTIGVPLFTRTRNDIQLTPAGTRLLKYAESILNADGPEEG